MHSCYGCSIKFSFLECSVFLLDIVTSANGVVSELDFIKLLVFSPVANQIRF